MASFISHLSEIEKIELFEALNYLNMDEITTFCSAHDIPFVIYAEKSPGRLTTTYEKDRKGVILKRVKHYLKTGKISKPTIFSRSVVSLDGELVRPKETDRIYYKQYNKNNKALNDLLWKLTDGEFKDGAIARILIREFWENGKAPTIKEFALAWKLSKSNHNAPNVEWAFLADRAKGINTTHWKKLRVQKADFAKKMFRKIFSKGKNL